MALGSTQPPTEISIRTISGGKGGRYVGLTTLPPSCADCLKILGASTSWNPQVLSRHVMGLLYLYLYLLDYNTDRIFTQYKWSVLKASKWQYFLSILMLKF
jgi:hypothetical protein